MSDSAASHLVDLRDLRLDTAHALLAQAGGSEAALHREVPSLYLQGLIDGLCELSLKDPLTGLANRRHFRAVLEREIDRVTRSGEAALLLMLDIDHFKKVNDTHGHLAGDVVLQSVARTLSASVRPMDTLARYGGEEFAVVLTETDAAGTRLLAEKIRAAVEQMEPVDPTTKKLTVSLGACTRYAKPGDDREELLSTADKALYQAKKRGRNRVMDINETGLNALKPKNET